jgi:hypothetical protein
MVNIEKNEFYEERSVEGKYGVSFLAANQKD